MGQGGQDEMHSENVCISWSKPSNYQEGLRCHAPESGRTNGGKWKIEQCSELNQKPQNQLFCFLSVSFDFFA